MLGSGHALLGENHRNDTELFLVYHIKMYMVMTHLSYCWLTLIWSSWDLPDVSTVKHHFPLYLITMGDILVLYEYPVPHQSITHQP